MAMRGVLQGFDASAREIPGAAPSAAVTTLAAQLRPTIPHELMYIMSALLRFFGQHPCPCPVSSSLDVDVQASQQLVLILEYHGRDSQRLSEFPSFFQTLLEWCSVAHTPDPDNFRTAFAEALAENPPNSVWAFTAPDVVMFSGLLISAFDATTAGRPTDFLAEAAFRQLRARPATPALPPPVQLLPHNIQFTVPHLPRLLPTSLQAPSQDAGQNHHDSRSRRDHHDSHSRHDHHDRDSSYRRDYSDRARGHSRTRSTRSRSPPAEPALF
jgi:hypothetical protein